MRERKNSILFLIVGIAIGVLGFFLTDKYLLKSEETVTNNNQNTQKEETKNETKEESKTYTIEEINTKFNENMFYSYKNELLANKYGIKRVVKFTDEDTPWIESKAYYVTKNGKELKPSFNSETTTIEALKPILDGYTYIYNAYYDGQLELNELQDMKNDDSYLVISNRTSLYIYDKSMNLVGYSDTIVGGNLYYGDSKEDAAEIEIHDKYILLAEPYKDNRYIINKYTVENGELIKNLNEVLPETVECAMCK